MITVRSRKRAQTKSLGLLIILGLYPVLSLQPASATPPAAPQNLRLASDNDNDPSKEWLDTPHGYRLRQSRPRVLLTQKQLKVVIDRMYGPNAREPYQGWFNLVKNAEDNGTNTGFVSLALIYKATGETKYRDSFMSRVPTSGKPSEEELYGLDIMWNELSEQTRLMVMQRFTTALQADYNGRKNIQQSNGAPPYDDVGWGYHSAGGVAKTLAYAGLFAYTEIELHKDQDLFPFDANNWIAIAQKEFSENGSFYRMERRIAGDPAYNAALPGSFGGLYDNFSYDGHDESWSINILQQFKTITGIDRTDEFLRDKYKGDLWQNMAYPYRYTVAANDGWGVRAGSTLHEVTRVWKVENNTFQPNFMTLPLLTSIYQDGRVQYLVDNSKYPASLTPQYSGLYWWLIFYDDQLVAEPPNTNPTAMYFNGPGLVSMRTDWDNDAAFGVFLAGEGISRRYEDGNSFLLGRNVDVIVQAGQRTRGNEANNLHHWYAKRSISRNTIQIMDPEEAWDIEADGTTGQLHSGPPLRESENFGGQVITDWGSIAGSQASGFPNSLGIRETSNVIKYEHRPDLGYTYTVGDSAAAYTKKIDLFEREMLFLRPDVFVIFDRVNSVNPNFKKVWTIHTVDQPVTEGALGDSGIGMTSYQNAQITVIDNPQNVTYIDTLLPKQNQIVTRGGNSVLVNNKSLSSGQDITGADIDTPDLDIARWLEVFAVGSDTLGSLTIYGETLEGSTSEVLTFDGAADNEVVGRPEVIRQGQLEDMTMHWRIDQFKNHLLFIDGMGEFLITGNSETVLFGAFPAGSSWRYIVRRPFANSVKQWKKITRISTTDMEIKYLTISVPHHHDVENVNGDIYSFAHHSAPTLSGVRDKSLGQWTFNVEATQPQNLDNFLNVFSLKDPGVAKPQTTLLEGNGLSGVLVDSFFAIFANDRGNIRAASIAMPKQGSLAGLFLNLEPNTDYFYKVTGNQVDISRNGSGGTKAKSSAMGTLKVNILIE